MNKHLLAGKKNKAFTLIELLAIIVILAIIAVITVPIILNIIENAKKGAAADSAYGYKEAIEKYYLTELANNNNFQLDGSYTISDGILNGNFGRETNESVTIPISGDKPSGGNLTYSNNSLIGGCLTFGDYAVSFGSKGNITNTSKGSCSLSASGLLQNKKVSILGDSISTLKTYIPETNRARYVVNQEDAINGLIYISMNETWWGRLISDYNMTLGVNESWAGSRVSNTSDSNSGDIGPDRAMASITRIQALDDNGTPDVIFFFGGTNDIGNSVTLGTFDQTASYATTLDTTSTKYNSFVEAYSITLMRLKHYYPNATIISLLPLSTRTYYTDSSLAQYKEQMKNICNFYDIKYIDLGNAGINSSNLSTYLVDGIHPNSTGMQLLSNYIISTINSNFVEVINEEDDNNLNTHLQELPENITPTTNLYTALTPEVGYYSDSEYAYGRNNGKDIISITIPVQEGDHISANSFGSGSGHNGIRCTMLNDGEIVNSLSPTEVYSSYTANGYIEIPSGVNSINIAWWGEDESNWAYLGDWNGHAQLLPENVTSLTNLYTALTPQTGFYNANSYTNYNNVVSITIPVQEGDHISANSFGTNTVSGSSNGIRCTMLKGNQIVSSLTPTEVYSAYTSNGYVEIPSGVTFVNIAWWEANEANWAHIEKP